MSSNLSERVVVSHLHCTGWWEQAGFGRQTMDGLLVVVEEHRITGSGIDMVGPFTLSGVLDADATVHLVKEYMGQHHVDYVGHYDGSSRLWGHWRINQLHGSWEIRIKANGTQQEDKKEKPEAGLAEIDASDAAV